MTCCVVCDLGAGSGRVMLARHDGTALSLTEVHRFGGYALERSDGLRWDLPRIVAEVETGIALAARAGGPIASIGIDSWGLDHALFDAAGQLLEAPFHYRHPRSARGWEACPLPAAALFAQTASQILPVNSVYQLTEAVRAAPEMLQGADRLLMVADAVAYALTGVARGELTLARTTGLMDADTGEWSAAVCGAIGLERRLLPEIIEPGKVVGALRPEVARRLGVPPVPVIAVAAHDTASAVAALGLDADNGFLVLGSWSLVGAERDAIDRRPEVLAAGFGNEGGVSGRPYLVRSLNGLHLIQKLRESAHARGADLSFAEIGRLAAEAGAAEEIDPADPVFFSPADMMTAIAEHFSARGHPSPQTIGGMARAIYGGLAAEVTAAVEALERLTGGSLRELRVCGGGAQDRLLCRLIAESTGKPLVIGPVEATSWETPSSS